METIITQKISEVSAKLRQKYILFWGKQAVLSLLFFHIFPDIPKQLMIKFGREILSFTQARHLIYKLNEQRV